MIWHLARIALVGLVALAPGAAIAADDTAGGTEIHLSQEVTRTVTPDSLRASLRLELKGSDGRQLQADLNRRMATLLEKAKAVPAVKTQTGAYSVTRDFTVKAKETWQATETITLTSKDFTALLSLAGDLQDAGMLTSGTEFFVAPETLAAAQGDLTAAALAALRARAQAVAGDLGMIVARYASITVGNVEENGGPRPMPRMMSNMAAGSSMPPPVAQAGDATIMLTVSATVLLATPKP
jgi:predicted secreted protein